MKELSIEEKAKRYDEAIYRVKHFLTVIGVSPDDEPVDVAKRMSEYIFSELAESEDERIRKWFEKQNEWRDMNGNRHCDMESFEDFRKTMDL